MKAIDQVVNTVGGLLDMGDAKDAVSILKRDHREVEAIFLQWSNARSQNKKMELMNQYIKNLTIHASVEEDLVYPILEDSKEKKTHSRTKEAEEEHHVLKMAIADLADAKPGSEELEAKMQVINEIVQHHVKEEESELLPALKKSGVNLDRLGQQILQRKQQLMADVSRGGGIGKNKKGEVRKSGSAVAARTASERKAKTANGKSAPTSSTKSASKPTKKSTSKTASKPSKKSTSESAKKSSSTRATASKSRKLKSASTAKKSAARKSTKSSSAVKKTASGRSTTGRTAASKRRSARKAT